ncbi:hypothetical protein NUW54_g14681 [Trametes sanguinea]|uniref:Uncharacterized protein n=1 Tax=Trametes sanguinea TaxID=158606 RepID=A0ACC1MCR0_9APHY|nr:hypothetical protein NUW54_g14681 [Trametes sanguinea]
MLSLSRSLSRSRSRSLSLSLFPVPVPGTRAVSSSPPSSLLRNARHLRPSPLSYHHPRQHRSASMSTFKQVRAPASRYPSSAR